ncbi:MAG: tRNA pseudouridine(54/55) synthase Pus10 [Promethearchaeota archaeon]
MNILDKVLEIYHRYFICSYCLGRMFALLGTDTTNFERGSSLLLSLTLENHRILLTDKNNEHIAHQNLKILAENANFSPAQKVLEKEGFEYNETKTTKKCYLCHDIFLNLQKYVDTAINLTKNYEYNTFLCGTRLNSKIINYEDKFKAEFNLLESESFKNHFNREIGKLLSSVLNKPPEFEYPDILFIFSLDYAEFEVQLLVRSLFISGKYNKLIRGIPQTKWPCRKCQGKGCDNCNYSGTQYDTSVEQLINPLFIEMSKATGSKFHGAGREDIDVRMLGNGRPFILELKEPKKRDLDLDYITEQVNKKQYGKVKISDLRYSNKKEVISLKKKAECTKKVYLALVEAEESIDKKSFENKLKSLRNLIENNKIYQRTPFRVSHRRADLIREKFVYKIESEYLSPNLFKFTVKTQGGTYIKELISGDEGRTTPSFSEVFGSKLICKELDVIDIKE